MAPYSLVRQGMRVSHGKERCPIYYMSQAVWDECPTETLARLVADYTGTWVARPMVVADVTSCAARSILQFFR